MEKEIAEILRLFKLEPKKNEFAKALSGGMKRKLSVGIALIGGSKVRNKLFLVLMYYQYVRIALIGSMARRKLYSAILWYSNHFVSDFSF